MEVRIVRVHCLVVLVAVAASLSVLNAWAEEVSPTPAEQPFAPFAGTWQNRDAVLTVNDMLARFSWKTGACTGEFQPEPCDQNISGIRIYGGLAEMVLTMRTAEPPLTAHGRVVLTNRYDMFPRGYPVVLIMPTDNVITLEQPRPAWDQQLIITLCRPPRDPNTCD